MIGPQHAPGAGGPGPQGPQGIRGDGEWAGDWAVPPSPPPPPAFGRGPVTGGVHDLPGGHGEGPRPISGEIHPRGPVPGPVPAPIPMSGFAVFQLPPPPDPREVVCRRAVAGRRWAIVTAAFFGLGAFATWGSFQSPGGSPLLSFLLGPLAVMLYFFAVVSSAVLGAYVISTLRALADRARRWQPPLARSHRTIGAMHLWPGRNVAGPVVILAETGVRGIGQWAWFATCALWPLALVSVVWSDSALGVFRTGVLATIAAVATAVTAASLARALSPPDPRRMVPGAEATVDDIDDPDGTEQPFWSRGLITTRRPNAPKTVVPPIDDSITSLYEEKS
ncbi:hypothetical protein ACFORJ_10825 [Corynebacterium hansenii]|uniref:Uncharacterized protein n=1 Tax=Corynebacterium hansenii TaxID=394964 RepID=A0ABV7ZR95_9CORY|nr:hypothetical protein [Corynebacterium hansenii]WJZ01250.1 hypothetical protein CHAN_13340 [Corynebacterium hansenii]